MSLPVSGIVTALDRLAADTTKASATVAFRLQSMRAQEQLDVLPTSGQSCTVGRLASGRT